LSKYIRARTPIAPILREPRAAATQETQLLFVHCAEVLSIDGKWLRVRGADSYEGFVHEGYTEAADGCEWGWDDPGEMSMGGSMRDSKGSTIDLPLGALLRGGKALSGRSLNLERRREIFPQTPDSIVA
jgi:hypothetical protein